MSEKIYRSIPAQEAGVSAEREGFKLNWGEANRLTIDLDDGKTLNMAAYALLIEKYDATIVKMYTSKSGNGKHYVIRLNRNFDAPTRGAFQLALGDDPKRVILCLADYHDALEATGIETEPFVLYEPTDRSRALAKEPQKKKLSPEPVDFFDDMPF
jgi:hypothetical protein